MSRRRLIPVPLVLLLSYLPLSAAMAQTGYVHLRTYPAGLNTNADLGVYRTFIQGTNGLQETFTQEFTPGPHTLAQVEALNGPCRGTAQNVSFTIKTGQWTDVDVPVSYVDCSFQLEANALGGRTNGGSGTALAVGLGFPGFTYASCQIGVTNPGFMVWSNFRSCEGTAPYGSTVTLITTAGGHSCCDAQGTFVADENQYGFLFAFTDTTSSPPPDARSDHDLGVTLVGGSYGGQVMTSSFRVVNHGPDNAYNISISSLGDSAEDIGDWTVTTSISDGNCPLNGGCYVNFLPAGDSTTFTWRYSGRPGTPGDTTAANFPFVSAFCLGVKVYSTAAIYSTPVTDNNPSNDIAPCILNTVPVTVTLGGNTPASQTVQKGSTGVPMLAFALNPTSLQTLQTVTIQAQGTGNEQVDVTAVKLYLDGNGDGLVDSGDSVVASGTFPANNGSVILALTPGLAITGPTNLLVTYDFSFTIVQRLGEGVALAILPLCLVPVARRRKGWAAGALVLLVGAGLSSCGGSDSTGPAGNSSTYQVTLTGLNISGVNVPSLSLAGATITITK